MANLTLDLLGQSPINSIDTPESRTEKILERWYDPSRRAVLSMFPWNFATKRDLLVKLVDIPEFDYEAKYALPLDYINLIKVGSENRVQKADYAVENGELLINDFSSTEGLPLKYVYDCEAVSKFDSIFAMALPLYMAHNIGPKIMNISANKKEQLKQDFKGIMILAGVRDAVESPIKRTSNFSPRIVKRRIR